MTGKIPMHRFSGAQHLRCLVSTDAKSFIPQVMDIYAGWIVVDASTSLDLLRDSFDSFVPLGPPMGGKFAVQQYPLGATMLVSASLSSFGGGPDTAAVDSGRVHLEHMTSLGSDLGVGGTPLGPGGADLLILTVGFAISTSVEVEEKREGYLNRVAYHITVLAPTQVGFDYDAHVLQLAPADEPL